ncbi:MAG: phytoene desaturase family protein [Candidatus Omnitrophota bacterium]
MAKKVVIVGAGVGGLAAACRLAKDGYEVEVYEKLSNCGGRNNIIEDRGYKFDTGPSLIIMPDLISELFSYCGRNIQKYLELRIVDPSYRIFYDDGEILNIYRNSRSTMEEMERMEFNSGAQFNKFFQETARIYNIIRPHLYSSLTPWSLVCPHYWGLIAKTRIFQSYWKLVRKYFESDKLCHAFTFGAVFMGLPAYQAPAFLSLINYAEHAQKISFPIGGMYQIPLALEKLAKELGVNIYYDSPVENIRRKDGQILLTRGASQIQADYAVINADYPYSQSGLLKRSVKQYKYSSSIYSIFLGIKRRPAELLHYNLFFSKDPTRNLEEIFESGFHPADPTFYAYLPTLTDPYLAPTGKDILHLMIPVPNLKNDRSDLKDHESRLRMQAFDKINKVCSCNLEEYIEAEHRFYPEDFIGRYNIKFGASFGLAHNLTQSGFWRPSNSDPWIKNLYYCGASTQPAGGLSLVIAGSKIVADLINKKKTGSA